MIRTIVPTGDERGRRHEVAIGRGLGTKPVGVLTQTGTKAAVALARLGAVYKLHRAGLEV